MTQLWMWKYKGQDEFGILVNRYCATGKREFRWLNGAITRWEDSITNLRKAKVVDETEPKTYLTTDQFIKVYKSLSDEKSRELGKAYSAAWNAAYSAANAAARRATWRATWSADLAILAKDAITKEHFNILMQPWTSCDLSPYAEDWEAVLNPKVTEPKGFPHWIHITGEGDPFLCKAKHHISNCKFSLDRHFMCECGEESMHKAHLINPVVISEGVSK